jgi:hypothetical protein
MHANAPTDSVASAKQCHPFNFRHWQNGLAAGSGGYLLQEEFLTPHTRSTGSATTVAMLINRLRYHHNVHSASGASALNNRSELPVGIWQDSNAKEIYQFLVHNPLQRQIVKKHLHFNLASN